MDESQWTQRQVKWHTEPKFGNKNGLEMKGNK